MSAAKFDGSGMPDDHRGPRAVQHQPRAAARPGAPVGDGPDASSRPAYDLYATPWRTFRQITFPQLLPAIVAGFLLAFTFSFDDYVITSFVSGPGSSTLPLFIFGQVKRGVTPETNAVATMMLLFTLAMLALGQLVLTRNARRSGGGSGGDMASMIAQQSG